MGAHLGLKPVQRSGLVATMDGFAVLSSSKTEVLRDGDTLLVSQGRKRGTAAAFAAAADEGLPPAKKRGAGASSSGSEGEEEEEKEEAGGTSSSEPSSSSSSDDEEAGDTSSESASSSSSEDDEDSASSSSDSEDGKGAGKAAAGTKSPGFQTPADKATHGTAVRCHTMHCVCAAAAHRPVQQAQRSAMAQASVFLLFITPTISGQEAEQERPAQGSQAAAAAHGRSSPGQLPASSGSKDSHGCRQGWCDEWRSWAG